MGLSARLQLGLGVFALAVVFVSVASLIHKYRLWQAEKIGKAQKLLSGAQRLETILAVLEGFALPQDLGDFCRDELLARYRGVQLLFPSSEDVKQRIGDTELKHPGRGGTWDPPQLPDETALNRYTRLGDNLINVDASDGIVTLTGNVSTWYSKCRTPQVAEHILGVKGIVNKLMVTRQERERRTASY